MANNYLNEIQHIYPLLTEFIFSNGIIKPKTGLMYYIDIKEIPFEKINPIIYKCNKSDFLDIVNMLSLMYKKNVLETDKKFILNYLNRYIKYNYKLLSDNTLSQDLVWALSIPIHMAFDNNFEKNETAIIIKEILNKETNTVEKSANLTLTRNSTPKGSFFASSIDEEGYIILSTIFSITSINFILIILLYLTK